MSTVWLELETPAPAPACDNRDGCLTCGDVAVELTVERIEGSTGDSAGSSSGPVGIDAVCRDADGRVELVATELVGPVAVGDRLLVHAGVALERLAASSAPSSSSLSSLSSSSSGDRS